MELCYLPRSLTLSHHHRPFNPNSSPLLLPRSIPSLSSPKTPTFLSKPGLRFSDTHLLRSNFSEETSTVVKVKLETGSDEAATSTEEEARYEAISTEEAPSGGELGDAMDFLNKFNLQLESEDTYAILTYGTGALVALWISSAIVSAFDSLPLFPKLMEVVGLGYTVWFTYRYLIFKKNREELFAKIEELKEQIIGATDD